MKFVEPIKDEQKIVNMYHILKDNLERDALMFRVGLNTMLRISDILRLKRGNFFDNDTIREYLRINAKKRNRRLKIPINSVLGNDVKEYCDMLHLDDDDYLFFSLRNPDHPIDRVQAWRIFNTAALKCGIKHFGTHSIRKTAAVRVYNETKDLALVQQMLGHRSPSTTIRYLGLNQDSMDEAFIKYAF
tara:strand:+ start:241 stop:804 length:564 start_codon:yes stop_codon:yes gene_type:complete